MRGLLAAVLFAVTFLVLAAPARADWRSAPMRFVVVRNTLFSIPAALRGLAGAVPPAPAPHQLGQLPKLLPNSSGSVFRILSGSHATPTVVWGIVAEGVIDAHTPEAFRQLLLDTNLILARGTKIFFLSPGGNLVAGLTLGREIRKAGFSTVVGLPRDGKAFAPIERSVCASACTFAFLGGISRSVAPGSIYAVHRFFRSNFKPGQAVLTDPTKITRLDQQLAGDLVAYIRSMGVSADLYKISTEGSRDRTVNLSPAQMAALRVTTHREISAHMLYEPDGHAVLVMRDVDGGIGHGRMDLYCSPQHRLYDRAYFPTNPIATSPPVVSHVSIGIFSAPGSKPIHVSVPPNAYFVGPPAGGHLPIDIYIPPGAMFQALQNATKVQVQISGSGLLGGTATDQVGGKAVAIPPGVRLRLAAIGRGC